MSQELIPHASEQLAAPKPANEPSSIQILEAAVKGGITSENVAVVKEIIAMRRDEMAHQNKIAFNRAFFRLKQRIAEMDFYADKQAETRGGAVAYTYCSEKEISSKLDPVLFEFGFAMMFGQRQDGDRVVAEVTLIHADGHEEKREYSVRTGQVNAMKDATAVDSGSTTSAWRHLVIKWFGLKSRISEEKDARNLGEVIGRDKVEYLRESLREAGGTEEGLCSLAGVAKLEEVTTAVYPVLVRALEARKRSKK